MIGKTDLNANKPELWGGLECTVNRVWDEYFSQMERNGHATRAEDLERFASLGIRAIRYPVLWERTAPVGLDTADWSWSGERLTALQRHGITPIAGLVHHGSGPRHTSLIDDTFAERLAEFAGPVARRYPWLEYYTPINEPLTTARFSGLYGVWYPHARDERSFVRALIKQCRGVVLSMRAIRQVNLDAKLIHTDDLGKSYSTPQLSGLADFYNERRWLPWDLLCGNIGPDHALWDYLLSTGIDASEFLWFRDHPCPPDIIGMNYYAWPRGARGEMRDARHTPAQLLQRSRVRRTTGIALRRKRRSRAAQRIWQEQGRSGAQDARCASGHADRAHQFLLRPLGPTQLSHAGATSPAAHLLGYLAKRPAYSALGSERAILLPSLDDALARYIHLHLRQQPAAQSYAGPDVNYGNR